MQQHTSTTAHARVQVWSLWIDRAPPPPPRRGHPRPRRGPRPAPADSRLGISQPPSYLEDRRANSSSDYQPVQAMSVSTTPQSEERAARERVRAIQRARAAKAKADASRARRGRSATSSPARARRSATARSRRTARSSDLLALGAGCTAGRSGLPHARRDPAGGLGR